MKPVRACVLSAALGVFLLEADAYFGKHDGRLGFCILGILLLAGLLYDFYESAQSLIHPRRLDMGFVAGLDFAGRKSDALRNAKSAGRNQIVLPMLTGLILGLLTGHSPLFVLSVPLLYPLESLLITLLILALLRFDALPLSKRKFSGGNSQDTRRLPSVPFFLGLTHALSRSLSSWIPGRYGWILRRKLIHLMRADPVFLAIYLLVLTALGIQFLWTWSAIASATFALTACMLSLTLVQLASSESDASYREMAYLMPPEGAKYRTDLLLSLAIAGSFIAYFTAANFLHRGTGEGWATMGHAREFWQPILTLAAFPLLLMSEKPGMVKTTDARVVLNFAYLGLAGSLFIFPLVGAGLVAAVLCFALIRCLQFLEPVAPT